MVKKRHLTKAQILAALKDQKQNKMLAEGGPFTGIVTIMNYVLWKYKGWEGNKLIEFNERFHEYYNDDEPNRKFLYDRLYDACDWGVEFNPFTEADMHKTGNVFYDALMKKNMEYDNTLNALSTMYLLFSFNTLLDMKVKPHKITEIKEEVEVCMMIKDSIDDEKVSRQKQFDRFCYYLGGIKQLLDKKAA